METSVGPMSREQTLWLQVVGKRLGDMRQLSCGADASIEVQKKAADSGIELISPSEIMHEALKSEIMLDSLYAVPPLLLNLCSLGSRDSCLYLSYEGWLIPIVIRRTLGIFALAQHSPPQLVSRSAGTGRMDVMENIKVLKSTFPALLIKLRQYPFDDAYLQSSAHWARGARADKLDFRIDLTNPVKALYARVSRDHRNRLRKALTLGDNEVISSTVESLPYCVRDDTSEDGVRKFGALLGHTLRKIPSQESAQESEKYIMSYASDYALLRRSFSTLRGYGLVKIFIAYDETGDLASGAVVLVSGRFTRSPMALWWLAGSTPEGNVRGLSVALQWAIITWLIRNGYDRYYMGGVRSKDTRGGPDRFKRGFGGQYVPGHVLWYSPLPFLSELAGRSGTGRWLGQ